MILNENANSAKKRTQKGKSKYEKGAEIKRTNFRYYLVIPVESKEIENIVENQLRNTQMGQIKFLPTDEPKNVIPAKKVT